MPYSTSRKALKNSAINLGLGILIIAAFYLFFDIKARLEFQQVYNDVQRIGTEVIEPMGGVVVELDRDESRLERGRNL